MCVALGAGWRRVLTGIFRRPLTQVGLGIAAGATLIAIGALALSRAEQLAGAPGGFSVGQVGLLVAYAAFMLGVCLLACVVPTRRGSGWSRWWRGGWSSIVTCLDTRSDRSITRPAVRFVGGMVGNILGACDPRQRGEEDSGQQDWRIIGFVTRLPPVDSVRRPVEAHAVFDRTGRVRRLA